MTCGLPFGAEAATVPKMGSKKPKLGTRRRGALPKTGRSLPTLGSDDDGGLLGALFPSAVQRRVLALLFGQPERAFGKMELIGLVGGGSGAVQRVVERLVHGGLVTERSDGGRRYVQANAEAPLFAALTSIIDRTAGIPTAVKDALAPVEDRIAFAALFGSVAKGTDRAGSDVDVLVVSDDLGYGDVYDRLMPVEARIGRTLSPTIYNRKEFETRWQNNNAFLRNVLTGAHKTLIGSIDAARGA